MPTSANKQFKLGCSSIASSHQIFLLVSRTSLTSLKNNSTGFYSSTNIKDKIIYHVICQFDNTNNLTDAGTFEVNNISGYVSEEHFFHAKSMEMKNLRYNVYCGHLHPQNVLCCERVIQREKQILKSSVVDPEPEDPYVLGLPDPDPLVRGTDPNPESSFSKQI